MAFSSQRMSNVGVLDSGCDSAIQKEGSGGSANSHRAISWILRNGDSRVVPVSYDTNLKT